MNRRRSTAVPVRPSELFNFQDDAYEVAIARASAVPRQLNFNRKPLRTSISGRSHAPTAVPQRPRPRMSLAGRAINEDSVMEGVSLLNQTTDQSDVTIQVPKESVASVSSGSVRSGVTSLFGKKSDILKPKNVPESSSGLLSKKTAGSLNGSAEKSTRQSTELNSTAAFENEEIAALTSTPHPDRKSKSVLPLSSTVENSELAEQMKLFVMDQRNLMQVVKLSFQKMNSVMDQMNSLMSKLNLEVDSQYELKLVKKSEPLPSFDRPKCEIDGGEIINPNQSSKSESNSGETILSNSVPNDDKENVDVKLENVLSMYSDLKSQLKCLKTPTSLRTRPLSAETPNTVLSNAVHHQLENLYETVEIDN